MSESPSHSLLVVIQPYKRPAFDLSLLPMLGLAVTTVIAGAWLSAAKDRRRLRGHGSRQTRQSIDFNEQDAEGDDELPIAYIDVPAALSFVVCASFALLLLFYFIHYLIYFLLLIFALGGGQALFYMLLIFLHTVSFPAVRLPFSMPYFPMFRLTSRHLVPATLASVTSITWIIYRGSDWAWILQDALGIALLLQMQRVLRLPDARISAVLLTLLFFYDIFMVFISPLFFSSSVMVTVASGGDTGEPVPMLLRFPRLNDPLGGYTMLGLGDIALPSLFISYLARFDVQKQLSYKDGYFVLSVVGYTVGLVLTYIALALMQKGQPALLYIVPCTLGLVLFVARKRGDLSSMWSSTEEERQEQRRQGLKMNGGVQHHLVSDSELANTTLGSRVASVI